MTRLKQVTAVGAFVFDQQNRIFLAKFAKKFQKQWSIPGGKIDFGENPQAAVQRELKEETNIELSSLHYFTHGSFVVDDHHIIYIDYIGVCPASFEVQINEEFSEWGFFAESELHGLDIIPQTKMTALKAMRFRSQQRFASTLAQYNLGLIRKTVCVQNYQSRWHQAYQWVHEQLEKQLGKNRGYTFEHFGSTSIEGLAAKPVLDILLEFSDAQQFQNDIAAIEQLGFTYKGDGIGRVQKEDRDPTRHCFAFYNSEENIDYIHLHALPTRHAHISNILEFRDALRASSLLRLKYADLKQEFLAQGLSRQNYTLSKNHFIQTVLAKT